MISPRHVQSLDSGEAVGVDQDPTVKVLHRHGDLQRFHGTVDPARSSVLYVMGALASLSSSRVTWDTSSHMPPSSVPRPWAISWKDADVHYLRVCTDREG